MLLSSRNYSLLMFGSAWSKIAKICLVFCFFLCFSAAHAKQIVTKPIVSYYVTYSNMPVDSPNIEGLVRVVNESRAKSNALCISGWCTDALFSTNAVGRAGPLLNGLSSYYDVGENMGRQWNTESGQVYGAYVQPLWVKANQVCKWPFNAVYSADSTTMECVFNEQESNACGAGNPIDIATGVKYEQEVDYTSADGVLKVERFYVNQNIGWVVDQPIKLSILPQESELELPEYAYKQVVTFTKSIVDNPASYYSIIYYPRLYNPTLNRSVYVWLGRKMLHFIETSPSVFSADSMDGKKIILQELNLVDVQNAKWRLILENQDTHFFSAGGALLRSEVSNGGIINYEYTDGRLSAKVDQKGRRLAYAYDADDRLTTITQPDGNTITYTYGADKNAIDFNFLTKVTWSNGESLSYLYNEPSNVTGINPGTVALTGKLNTNGQRIGNYKYQGPHAISTERYMGVEKKQLTFGSSTTVTDALNAPRTYHFYQPKDGQRFLNGTSQPAGSGCAATTKYTEYYLETDLKKSEADFNGNKQQFAYEMSRKLETVRVEGIPKSDSIDYLLPGKALASGMRKISTQWHSQWRSPVKKAEPKTLTTYIYNGDADPFNGNQIANCANFTSIPLLCRQVQQATADTDGQLGLSAVLDTTMPKREWIYTYNAQGQLLTRTRGGAVGADETREYYVATGVDYRAGDLKSITNAVGHKTQFIAYDANGHFQKVHDANNTEIQFTYDARGRLLSQVTAQATTTHSYDLDGNRNKTIFPNGMVVNYEYDPAKRLISIGNVFGDKINYEYDLESNLRFERITNPSGTITYLKEHIYDALSREKNLVNSLNQSRTHLYDANGNSTGEIDAKQQTTSHSFDALNQLKLTTDALAGKTEFSYNAQGHITAVKDSKNNSTAYTYNAFGELTQQVSPDTGITTFTYDAAGNRTSAKDARGVVVNYTYDAINRLTLVNYPASPTENITYSYDGTANGSYGVGRLTSVVAAATRNDYEYNYQGFISKKFTQVGALLSTTQYTYDTSGNLTTIIYPSGRSVSYSRDAAGRVQSTTTKANITAAAQTIVSNINYLPFGPISSYSYGNNLTHTNSFDNDYRLTSIQVGGIMSRGYGYDLVDNITGIADGLVATKTQTLGYDPLNRLTNAKGSYGTLDYTYDAVGNRLSEKAGAVTGAYNYDTASNRLLSITKTNANRSFAYDAAGNRIQGTSEALKQQDYTYNKANRLASVNVTGALAVTYTYNALGQRVRKLLANNTQEVYQYDEAGQLISVSNGSGKLLREYIYNNTQLVGFINTTYSAIANINLTAASAVFQGSHVLSTAQTGYSAATGYIDFVGEGQSNWSFNVVTSANYDISVRYSIIGADAPIELLVDGVKKGVYSFPLSTNLNTWRTVKINLPLTAGAHTLSLKTTGKSGPNVDKITLSPTTGVSIPTASLYFAHNDHLGTPQVITAQNQSVVWAADYQPFGKLKLSANKAELFSRFPGQYVDNETGLYYNYFRDYDPSIGRYIESDPIGLDGGINTYAYVEGNPLKYIDPSGQSIGGVAVSGITYVVVGTLICYATHCFDQLTNTISENVRQFIDACTKDDDKKKCDPPAGEKFNKVTHYVSHSSDPDKGSHGCMAKTGSPVHWHYDVNDQTPDGKCFTRRHVFGGCGVAL